MKQIKLIDILTIAAIAAILFPAFARAEPIPAAGSTYYSGGPYKAGASITLPDGRKGVIVGDFHQIPNGEVSKDNPGTFQYAVMVPAKGDDCHFGLSIVMIDTANNKDTIVGEHSADKAIAHYQSRLETARARALAATKEGRVIQAEADKQFEKWNKRNDRSVAKFTTKEGYASLVIDMALAGTADKAKKGLKTNGDVDRIFKEAIIDAVKNKASADLPLSIPPLNGNQAANVELTKGNIKGILAERLKGLPKESRGDVAVSLLVQFAGNAVASEDNDFAEAAIDALTDVAIDLGLSEYPIAGPLAKEAVDLAKQFNGYLGVIEKNRGADAQFTTALNAFNEAYGARQSLVLMKSNKAALLKQASDELYKEDPKLEAWLVEKVGAKMNRPLILPGKKTVVVGPVAPGEKDDFKLEPLDNIALEWQVPFYIESAGTEDAFAAAGRLNVDRVVGRRGGRLGGYDMGVDTSKDPLAGLRNMFDPKNNMLMGRNFLEPNAFQPPPKPTLSEKEALERDCRLKRMAEAERLVPRIAPQVKFFPALKLIGGLNGEGRENDGLEIYRGSDTRPLLINPGYGVEGRKMRVGWQR